MKTFVMLLPSNNKRKGMDAVYSVLASTYEEARETIIRKLTPKPNRHAILRSWLSCGQPVRILGEHDSTRFTLPVASLEQPA